MKLIAIYLFVHYTISIHSVSASVTRLLKSLHRRLYVQITIRGNETTHPSHEWKKSWVHYIWTHPISKLYWRIKSTGESWIMRTDYILLYYSVYIYIYYCVPLWHISKILYIYIYIYIKAIRAPLHCCFTS